MQISFFQEDAKYPSAFKKTPLRALVKHIISQESKKSLEYINFIICSDEFLLGINQKYLQHDYYTDIITFDYSSQSIASDIYMSIDRISENAAMNSVSLLSELYRIMIHGVLHLSGYDDQSPSDKMQMTTMENVYLQLIK